VKQGKNLNQTLVASPHEAVPDLPFTLTCSCYLHILPRQRGPSLRQICPPTRRACHQRTHA